jgi:hypothetical protein
MGSRGGLGKQISFGNDRQNSRSESVAGKETTLGVALTISGSFDFAQDDRVVGGLGESESIVVTILVGDE